MDEAHDLPGADANLAAYERLSRELDEQYAGEFVAFCQGEFAGHGWSMDELTDAVAERYPGQPILVTRAAAVITRIRLRRPWRVSEA